MTWVKTTTATAKEYNAKILEYMSQSILSAELEKDSVIDVTNALLNPAPPMTEVERRLLRVSEIEYEIARLQFELGELKAKQDDNGERIL